jgi:hypothetical protein
MTIDTAFASIRAELLKRSAAPSGREADAAELRILHELHMNRDPVCWVWPAPASCTFPDDDTASRFLRWWCRECAICGGSAEGLILDHDHRTALVRGYVCRSCNAQEGKSDGGVYRKYRERNPASILGLSIRYYSSFAGWAEPEHDALCPAPGSSSPPTPDGMGKVCTSMTRSTSGDCRARAEDLSEERWAARIARR